MNSDVLISKWKPVPVRTHKRGSPITVINLDRRRGPFDRLVGVLQAKHGWNRERAAKELLRRIGKLRAG